MRWNELQSDDCPVARAQAVLGDRWTILILRDALRGVSRFDVFHERLGCSRTLIARRLAHLVEEGVLQAEPYQARPPRHDYRLTDQGRALGLVVMLMAQWGETWRPKAGAKPLRRRHKACGHEFQPMVVCSECGDPVGKDGVEYPGYPRAFDDFVERSDSRQKIDPSSS